jgi:cytochrome c oxidase subunit 1
MLPKQLGVKLFSDAMARVAFLMIMIFSIPIGVHHLFSDPGVSLLAKAFHSALTFVVAVPSFLTAFNLAATLERAGRKRGSKRAFLGLDFFAYLPWNDPVVVSQLGGMLLFLAGGITGVMNASFTLNIALHNTTWVVGHFHMTLAGAVFMTYMGILFWIMPVLTGRELWGKKLALAHAYLWLFGMLLFGAAMGRAGIMGAVRRSDLGGAGHLILPEWVPWLNISAFGGLLLLISSILLYVVIIGTIFAGKKIEKQEEIDAMTPIATSAPQNEILPAILENWGLWLAVIIISCVIMWGPVLLNALDWANGFWGVGLPAGVSP